ncbi:MAG: cell wall hydrolase [Oscillospiraceae bacterium]|nr:cell wall hydrolase [Oscillospiraceae bacterium]
MKKVTAFLSALMVSATILTVPTQAETAFDENVDYMSVMVVSATIGDMETGRAAEQARNAKIEALGSGYTMISFDDLFLLSKIIYAEAGSAWLPMDWKMCVGEVVLNRVASPEFPNTIAEVLAQPGQYYGQNSSYFNRLLPSETCVIAAQQLLEGQRIMNDETVVFQANFTQGSGIHTALYDGALGWTYFCHSARPWIYA